MCEWIFDGIGTELIGLVIGALLGGVAGYNIGIRSKSKQTQKAGDGANQQQTFTIEVNTDGKNSTKNSKKTNANINQSQTAGNKATQVQTGGTRNE